MGQKINPIIFRLSKTSDWKSKYFEKKTTESAVYDFKDTEIRKFIIRFFESNGMIIHNLKLAHSTNTLHIFASYFSTLKTVSFINNSNKTQKIKFITKKINSKNYSKYLRVKQNIKKYLKYKELNYLKNLKKSPKNKFFTKFKIFNNEKYLQKIRRIRFLKYYKNHLLTKQHKRVIDVKSNSFLIRFFKSLSLFTNYKINISLTLNKLNNNIKQELTKKKQKILKKNLVKLRRYERNEFFKEGVNVLFLCTTTKNSATLLSYFIAIQLKRLKKHNFFLKFVKNTLILFNTKVFSKLKGIKIKIKGRFNKAPRARHRVITIGNGVPALTLNSKIDYAETTSYALNGTFGVKVWICEKN